MGYNDKVYTKMQGYEFEGIRQFFHSAIPLKTLVIACPDPRASGAVDAVAREFNQISWPGEIIRDANGTKVGSTMNVGAVITTGGRAQDALRSITALHHLIGLENVVVVHHTWCGLTAFSADALIFGHQRENGGDISHVHDPATLCISNFDDSLRFDVNLVRNAPGTPRHLNVFGYVYDTDEDKLIKVIEDRGTKLA
ncbi:MAG: carbonic anhydrase [Burkholderiaceae bacterium]|nr:carbonic anhydrase [Burkholderiaceae bacterium]